VLYYRQNYPADILPLSILLGATPPVLASLVSLLKATGENEHSHSEQNEREAEREAEHTLKLQLYTVEQTEQTKRELAEQTERTKRERAKARTEVAKANAIAQVRTNAKRTPVERGSGRREPGKLDAQAEMVLLEQPGIGPRPLARELGCAPSTAAGVLKRVRGNGQ